MAISFRSQTFQDTRNRLNELADAGELTRENFDQTVQGLGVDPTEYRDAYEEYKVARDEGDDQRSRTTFAGRTLGRAIGETVDSAEDVFNVLTGSSVDFGEALPESWSEYASEIFDPYHGSNIYGQGEKFVGEVGSYFIPGTAAFKVGKGALALAKTAPGTRSLMSATAKKVGKKGSKAGKVAGLGLAGAAGTTFIEDPRDNLFDLLMDDERGEETVRTLSEYPDDVEAGDYLEAFIKNAAFEVPAAFALGLPAYLGKAYKARRAAKPKQKVSFLGKLNSNISSRLGTDDKTLAAIIRRNGAAKASIIRADGLAKDLDKTLKKEFKSYTPDIELKVNNALQYSDEGLREITNTFNRLKSLEKRRVDEINRLTGPARDKKIKSLEKFRKDKLIPTRNVLNEFRRNKIDYDELGSLAPNTRKILDEMRTNIDDLSTYVSDNVVKGKISGRIAGNKGFYLNRSYDVFDTPGFSEKLQERFLKFKGGERDEILENVQKYLIDNDVPPNEVLGVMEGLIPSSGEDTAEIFSFLANRSLTYGAGSSRILSKRSDIGEPIRAMWGEVKDPKKNYVKTFEKLATIKAEDKFLRELAEDLVSENIASVDRSLVNNIDLGAVAEQRLDKVLGRGKVNRNQARNPLEGLYIDPVYAKAIKEGLVENTPTSGMAKTFMLAKGATQTAKTVLSPATHGRNLIGNVIMLGANGIIPGFKSTGTALEQTASRLAGKNNKELGDVASRYAELGIIDSGIGANLIRRNLNAFNKGGQSWLDKTALTRGTRKVNTFLTNLYQSEDDMFKIIHFEKTKDYMRKAFPDRTTAEIEELAAQRTRDMMPNYSLVPRFVKNLRGAPIGDFIAFPAEMIRTSKNLVKYTLEDIASGNPELRKAGMKRLAGMTAAGIGGDVLSEHSRQFFNISSDEEEAINNLVPSYEYGQNRIYLSPINKDKMGHMGVNYINLGPLDPYAYIKTGARVAHKMIADGNVSDAGIEKAAMSIFDNQLGTFMEPSMITQSMIDLINGKNYREDPSVMGKIQKAAGIAVDPFVPGVANFLKKRYQYEQTKAGTTKLVSPFVGNFGDGKNLPEGITPYSFTISGYDKSFGGDVGIPAFFGLRNQRLDLTAGMRFAINPILTEIQSAESGFQKKISDPSLYSEDDAKDIYKSYVNSQKRRLGAFQKLKSLSDSYRSIFGDNYPQEIVKGMKLRGEKDIPPGLFNYLNQANSNYYIPTLPEFGPSERMTRTPIPYQNIFDLYQRLDGTKIEEVQ